MVNTALVKSAIFHGREMWVRLPPGETISHVSGSFLIFMVISYSVFADTCRIAVTAYQEAFRRAGVDGSTSARQVGNVIQGLSVVNNRGLSPHPHLGLVAQ